MLLGHTADVTHVKWNTPASLWVTGSADHSVRLGLRVKPNANPYPNPNPNPNPIRTEWSVPTLTLTLILILTRTLTLTLTRTLTLTQVRLWSKECTCVGVLRPPGDAITGQGQGRGWG